MKSKYQWGMVKGIDTTASWDYEKAALYPRLHGDYPDHRFNYIYLDRWFHSKPWKSHLVWPKRSFFVVLFTLIYSFMTDQGRAVSAQSIGLGMLYGGVLGCLIGVTLTLDLPGRDQAPAWKYAILPLWYGVIGKIFADAFTSAREPDKQMRLFWYRPLTSAWFEGYRDQCSMRKMTRPCSQ